VTRGSTSGKITKSAVLKDTKHELQVSAFVEIGDKIEIDTVTGELATLDLTHHESFQRLVSDV